MKSAVAIVRCPDYDPIRVQDAVEQAISLLGGIDRYASSGERILVKPNLLSARPPEAAATTHPTVVEAVVRMWQQAGASVSLGDSPPLAGEKPSNYARLLKATGMAGVAEKTGAKIVRFEDAATKLQYPSGKYYKSFEVARAAIDADGIISLPKLKTHGLTYLSSAIKNMFGCIPGKRKALFHAQAAEDRATFAQMLVDLIGAIPPRLSIVDAVVGMDGDGPVDGRPIPIGLIMAGTDPVALDAVACTIFGIDPYVVDTTRLASEQGFGTGKLGDIEILGENIEDIICGDFEEPRARNIWMRIPKFLRQPLKNQLLPYPVINKNCINCGSCVEECPVATIKSNSKQPQIELGPCIRCYCCREVCERTAIDLKVGSLHHGIQLIRDVRRIAIEKRHGS